MYHFNRNYLPFGLSRQASTENSLASASQIQDLSSNNSFYFFSTKCILLFHFHMQGLYFHDSLSLFTVSCTAWSLKKSNVIWQITQPEKAKKKNSKWPFLKYRRLHNYFLKPKEFHEMKEANSLCMVKPVKSFRKKKSWWAHVLFNDTYK